ncbi:hypothetical protein XENORESO_020083 [Xenotaenia resolanae]|uniref:Uncharacterized protein n=1 Tax=Xenotaenia resolanae TaxID=208358 RepID=A0ABV0WY38_9TELE
MNLKRVLDCVALDWCYDSVGIYYWASLLNLRLTLRPVLKVIKESYWPQDATLCSSFQSYKKSPFVTNFRDKINMAPCPSVIATVPVVLYFLVIVLTADRGTFRQTAICFSLVRITHLP